MKPRKKPKKTDHSGSTFDSFLEQEGIREAVEAVAMKRVLARQRHQECRLATVKAKRARTCP